MFNPAMVRRAAAADTNTVYLYTGPGGTATAPTTGDWNTATNWAGNAIPTSGANTELDFGGSGASG